MLAFFFQFLLDTTFCMNCSLSQLARGAAGAFTSVLQLSASEWRAPFDYELHKICACLCMHLVQQFCHACCTYCTGANVALVFPLCIYVLPFWVGGRFQE